MRVALDALADEPVRVLATTNRRFGGDGSLAAPANARVVEWVSYSQAFGAADLVICHGGHGTVARALGAGVPVLCCPAVGDMTENGARVAWAGAGLMVPWRLTGAASLRVTVRRVLGEPRLRGAGARDRPLGRGKRRGCEGGGAGRAACGVSGGMRRRRLASKKERRKARRRSPVM